MLVRRCPARTFRRCFAARRPLSRSFELVRPRPLAAPPTFPPPVPLPPYVNRPGGVPVPAPEEIEIKSGAALEGMRAACRLVKEVMDEAEERVRPGVTTAELDAFVHQRIISRHSYPSPLRYRGFPRSVCLSVNDVVCHGVPDTRPLADGDLVSLDVTVFFRGFHGDHCRTFEVGVVDEDGRRLVAASRRCLAAGVAACGPGVPFRHVGGAVEAVALASGCSVVPYFNGHGIGAYFHGPPDVKHYSNAAEGVMRPGMTFTVEPVICEGDGDAVIILDDGWTAVTTDGSRAAQFEHTLLITEEGVEILTE